MSTAQNLTVDLFIGSLVEAPIKDDRALMEFPFFSLEKTPRRDPIVYSDGNVTIRVEPGPKGLATIWDKDVLIYLISVINERIERGMPHSRTMAINVYDFLRTTGRGTGKDAYEAFFDTLFRLRSTTVTTDITSGDERERRGFGWIDNFRIVEREIRSGPKAGQKIMQSVEITVNQWMYRAIVKDRRVLTISKDYWELTSGLERRLYELARKHCGNQPVWRIGLSRLAEKCGSRGPLRNFKVALKRAIERNKIPDYRFTLVDDPNDPVTKEVNASLGRKLVGRRPNERIVVYVQPRSIECA